MSVCLLLIGETKRINKELYDTRMKHQWNNPLILQITGNHSNPWPHSFHLSALEQFPFVSIFASLNLDLSGGVHRCQRHKRLRAALRQTSCANNSDDCNDADTHSIESFFFFFFFICLVRTSVCVTSCIETTKMAGGRSPFSSNVYSDVDTQARRALARHCLAHGSWLE